MADPIVTARRQAIALNRLDAATQKLAKQHGLSAEATALDAVKSRDPALAAVLRTEALADFLEAMLKSPTTQHVPIPADAVGPATVETVEVIAHPTKEEDTKPVGRARKDKES